MEEFVKKQSGRDETAAYRDDRRKTVHPSILQNAGVGNRAIYRSLLKDETVSKTLILDNHNLSNTESLNIYDQNKVIQRQAYPYTIDRMNILYNKIRVLNMNRLSRNVISLLAETILEDRESQSIYIQNSEKDLEFETYIEQIINTCIVFKELLHVTYPPNEYKISETKNPISDSTILQASNNKELSTIGNFIGENRKRFHQGICEEYEEVITYAIKEDKFYKTGKCSQSEYSLGERGKEFYIKSVPEDNDNTYCIYRSMKKGEYDGLVKYFEIKEEIEQKMGDILAFVTDKKSDKARIRSVLEETGITEAPVKNHMGNLSQALKYGGILVKFKIKKDKAELLTGEYLSSAGEVGGGKQGNKDRNKISTKLEGKAGAKREFSFNLGSNLWASILFLSTDLPV